MTCFDAHSDLLYDVTRRRLAGEEHILETHHLDRLRSGGVEGLVLALWYGDSQGLTFWRDVPGADREDVRLAAMLDHARAELARCSQIQLVRTVREAEAAREAGKLYAFLGIEGMAAFGTDAGALDRCYESGVRLGMLTWNEENALATGVGGDPDRGLTAAGRAAVRKIQEKGMLLDVSHLNERSFWDAADAAVGPVIASHSNCRALCDVPRNLTDEQLRAVRDLGGVVGLNAFRLFVDPDPRRQDLVHLLRHAGHMIDVMGIDHVGCGFDFCEFLEADTMASMTEGDAVLRGLEDCARLPALLEGLRDMGLTAEEAEKIAFGNFHRLLRQVLG